MFVIHDDQVRAFAATIRARFEVRAAEQLSARLGRAIDVAAVHASVDRAFARGIETEPEVLQHAAIECALGGDLAVVWPWALETLEDDYLTPLGKLRTLLRLAAAGGIDVANVDLELVTARAR